MGTEMKMQTNTKTKTKMTTNSENAPLTRGDALTRFREITRSVALATLVNSNSRVKIDARYLAFKAILESRTQPVCPSNLVCQRATRSSSRSPWLHATSPEACCSRVQ